MIGSMVINTSDNGSLTITLLCLNCPLTIYDRDFGVDLIYFPLIQLDVILGMNRLEFNHVYIKYFDKTVLFSEPEESMYSRFMFVGQVEMSLVLMRFTSLRLKSKIVASDMPMVCEFPGVFLEDICDLPSE